MPHGEKEYLERLVAIMPVLADNDGGWREGVNGNDKINQLSIYLLLKLLFAGKSVLATSLQYRQFIYF